MLFISHMRKLKLQLNNHILKIEVNFYKIEFYKVNNVQKGAFSHATQTD